MIVLIDGYNLLRRVFSSTGPAFETFKRNFIQQINQYGNLKQGIIKQLILVFDGGSGPWVQEESLSGVQVVYAGGGKSADDLIIHFVSQRRNAEFVLVSSDRGLCKTCMQYQVMCVDVEEFYSLYRRVVQENRPPEKRMAKASELVKYQHTEIDEEFDLAAPSLDELMEQATRQVFDKDRLAGSAQRQFRGQGASVTPKKKEKRHQAVRTKLG